MWTDKIEQQMKMKKQKQVQRAIYPVSSKKGFVIIQPRGNRGREELLGADVMTSMTKAEL